MKEIKAYVPEDRLEEVLHVLKLAGAREVTFARVELAGGEVRPDWVDVLPVKPVPHYPHLVKLEMVCEGEEAQHYTESIRGVIGQTSHRHVAVSSVSVSE